MAQKPSIPKGTRDFSPSEVAKRSYIIDIIKKHFQVFGFQPIETPSFENSDTLMGKYGEEGDRLIFRILDSGEFVEKNLEYLRLKIYFDEIINTDFFIRFYDDCINSNNLLTNINSISDKIEVEDRNIIKDRLGSFLREERQLFKKNLVPSDVSYLIESALSQEFEKIYNSSLDIVSKIKISKEGNYTLWKSDLNRLVTYLVSNEDAIFSSYYSREISEKALRYDLTVPFARYVVMHQNEIDFPFKRYQIQPVWRADRPQKGRFREFYQCDADVVGANSLLQEVELIQLYDSVFTELGLNGARIKLNNRKILAGIAETIGAEHLLVDFTVALDKLDKIGEAGVKKEMLEKGISETAIELASPLFSLNGSNLEQLGNLRQILSGSELGTKGVQELTYIIESIETLELQSAKLSIDVTLARGLNYYTGTIFEVAPPQGVEMGSIGGGGRYDDLTGIFGLKDVSGVGISFGLDRIYLVLEELGLFPDAVNQSLDVLCVNFGEREALTSLKLVCQLRKSGIKADMYPTAAKMQKQMKYANNRNVPYVILIGEEEMANNSFVVKNMVDGGQQRFDLDRPGDFKLYITDKQ